MRKIDVPVGSTVSEKLYRKFLKRTYSMMREHGCIGPKENEDALELAHLIPSVPETVLAIHIGINDSVCTKSLVSRFLPRHAHHTIFAFDPERFSGRGSVPAGMQDIRVVLKGFEPPNKSWSPEWTYVYITDTDRTPQSLWKERGYIDLIPGKHEDFQLATDNVKIPVCFFVDKRALEHPVNQQRTYLKRALRDGERQRDDFKAPFGLEDSVVGLVPVILKRGERLYIASTNHIPCDHAWTALRHNDRETLPLVYESSAVPTELIYNRPARHVRYAARLSPPCGSSDLTTDIFFNDVYRRPILRGSIKG